MILETASMIGAGEEVIAEATFAHNDCLCLADILLHGTNGWELYEVKSSTSVKDIYLHDLAYQYYVITNAGFPIAKTSIVTIDKNYVRHGELDIHKLFSIHDLSQEIKAQNLEIERNLDLFRALLKQKEPGDSVSLRCSDPYDCGYWAYCTQHLPSPNVFDLKGERSSRQFECYANRIYSFSDILDARPKLLSNSYQQINYELELLPPVVDKAYIQKFLDELYYPLCFLDFETINPSIPLFENTSPYMQIPTQYSLHILDCEGGLLRHHEYLGIPEEDPRPALIEQLCRDIPKGACILAYNAAFEKRIIQELAKSYPLYERRLTNMADSLHDLMVPFKNRYYYNRNQQGSYSIKSVIPVLCPDDPELDYHGLEDIHNGSEAMNAYEALSHLASEQRKKINKQLLAYCRLDTLAMVKLWEKLQQRCN